MNSNRKQDESRGRRRIEITKTIPPASAAPPAHPASTITWWSGVFRTTVLDLRWRTEPKLGEKLKNITNYTCESFVMATSLDGGRLESWPLRPVLRTVVLPLWEANFDDVLQRIKWTKPTSAWTVKNLISVDLKYRCYNCGWYL